MQRLPLLLFFGGGCGGVWLGGGHPQCFQYMCVPLSGCVRAARGHTQTHTETERPTQTYSLTHIQESGEYFMSCCLLHNNSKLNVQESINLG